MTLDEIIKHIPKDKIFFQEPGGIIVNSDCKEILQLLPGNSIDLVLTDPPYNVLGKTQEWDNKGNISEFMKFTEDWLAECYRVLKPDTACYVFFGQKYIKDFFNMKTDFNIKRMLIWHHPNLAKPTRNMYLYTYDPIFYMVKGKTQFDASFVGSENVDVFNYPKPQSNWNGELQRFHPASKPTKLIQKLIKPTTKENDIILDPFLGSGTTAVAAKELGRKYIGIEISPKYCQIGRERLRQEILPL